MPATKQTNFDGRTTAVTDTIRVVHHWLTDPHEILSEDQMELLASFGSRDAEKRAAAHVMLDRAKAEGFVYNTDFQRDFKRFVLVSFEELMANPQLAEHYFLAIYGMIRPEVGARSFEEIRETVILKPASNPGTSALVLGNPSSGKTETVCYAWQTLRWLNRDRWANDKDSYLYRAGWLKQKPWEKKAEKELRDEASIGVHNLTQSDYELYERRLGLAEAKGVRFITNIPIRKHTGEKIYEDIYSGRALSELVQNTLDGDEAFCLNVWGFDEVGVVDEAQQSMRWTAFNLRVWMAQQGKFNCVTWADAQWQSQIRKQVYHAASIIIEKVTNYPYLADVTIPGNSDYQHRRISHWPRTDIDFISKNTAGLRQDLPLQQFFDEVNRRMADEADVNGIQPNHKRFLDVAREYLAKRKLTPKQMAEDRNPGMVAEVRAVLEATVERGGWIDRYGTDENGIREMSERLGQVHERLGTQRFYEEFKDWYIPKLEEERARRKNGGTIPADKDPDLPLPVSGVANGASESG